MDWLDHNAVSSTTEAEYNRLAKQPWVSSANGKDAEPGIPVNSYSLSQENFAQLDTSSLWADYWKIEDLDSKTSKEFYKKA
jgi:hypothetical protein